jgi:mono/diheme cytochrome c family protein
MFMGLRREEFARMTGKRLSTLVAGCCGVFIVVASAISPVPAAQSAPNSQLGVASSAGPSPTAASSRALVDRYCLGCHGPRLQQGKLRLDTPDLSDVGAHSDVWEKVARKLRGGVMPPPGAPRPDKATYDGLVSWLEGELDRSAAAKPNPGRTESFHRLNRSEYRNVVRDLFGLDIDFTDLLPIDDSGGGQSSFDNIAASLRLSQTLMEQYLSVALRVSRTAVGGTPPPAELIFKKSPELRQDVPLEGMPFGTRGGLLVNHIFPVDGEYDLGINVAGQGRGQIELAIDGERVKLFDYAPRGRGAAYDPDAPPSADPTNNLSLHLPIKAGPKEITVAFLKSAATVQVEFDRQPFEGGRSNTRMRGTAGDLGGLAGIDSLVIKGPTHVTGKGETPSRQRIFVCRPDRTAAEEACAKTVLTTIARRAYRRPLADHDVTVLMSLYKDGRAEGDFESGVERAIRGILVNPNFLFRVEKDPANAAANGVYRITDVELASRLSFFLWSSIPDDELLGLAEKGRLHDKAVLDQQVGRMLKDPKAESLTSSFAAQWLWVRNLRTASPAEATFPHFDEGLREAFRREMELFFSTIVREDRSAIDFLNADFTFLNERLAKHYGIPNVFGDDFRRVKLAEDSPRRGLLGKGALLLVTSKPTRTSPVVRGKWILENVLGTPPPAPPPNVPPLAEQKQADGRVLTVRELMAKHRANATCASCHAIIDPTGFALEQFDGIGRWRTVDVGFQPIDASGTLPDGSKFSGINEFRSLLLANRQQFVRTMTDKLTMYALGRGTDTYDGPAIRKVVNDAAASNYRFSVIVLGIVNSVPFQMRAVSVPTATPAPAQVARNGR